MVKKSWTYLCKYIKDAVLSKEYPFFNIQLDIRTQDHSRFSSCGGDRQVYYWDVSTGNTIRRFEGHNQVMAFMIN